MKRHLFERAFPRPDPAPRRKRGRAALAAALVLAMGAFAALLAPAVAGADAASAGVSATSIDVAQVAGATRFTLQVSGEPRYRAFVVDDPPRLVIDFDGLAFDLEEAPPAAGIITAFRYGALSQNAARIVFDLSEPALLSRHAFLPAIGGQPARLVFDFAPADAARFRTAAITASADARDAPDPRASDPGGRVVVIDPGHGGIDPGASTPDGTFEKDLVLAFAKRLEAHLGVIPGVSVRLTRSDDSFLSLTRRIKLARAYGADLFISLHADAAPQDYVHGATVYTLSERPSDAQAAAIAARENLSDSVSGAIEPDHQEEVSGILADLLRRETKAFSHSFAERLIGALNGTVDMNSNPHRSARFRVLMAHDIPSVLFEIGYLTNAADADRLLDESWQDQVAGSVAAAVAGFFSLDPPAGSERLAQGAGMANPQ